MFNDLNSESICPDISICIRAFYLKKIIKDLIAPEEVTFGRGQNENKTLNTNRFIKLSLLSAIAVILMYIDFPVIPIFPWLKIDLSDVPALMGAFAFGPLAGLIIELMKNLLILIVKGTGTGFVGELANFLVGVALVWPVTLVYKKNKTKKTAILGMVLGVLCIEVVGILANVYLLLPNIRYGYVKSRVNAICNSWINSI